MQIGVACECGEVLSVPAAHAGRSVLCQKCNRPVVIPQPEHAAAHSAALAEDPSLASGKNLPRATRSDELDEPGTRLKMPAINDSLEIVITPPAGKPVEAPAPVAAKDAAAPAPKKDERKPSGPLTPSPETEPPASSELVRGPDGKHHYKLTCRCGKRLLVAVNNDQPVGRCPKCNRRLRLPGVKETTETDFATKIDEKRLEAVSSGVEYAKVDYPPGFPPDAGPATPKPRGGSEHAIHLAAANTAAERLRKKKSDSTQFQKTGSDIITAWPLAGAGRRLLASFIDLTVALSVTAFLVVLAHLEILPGALLRLEFMLLLLPFSGFCCEAFVTTLWDGSLGKLLVVVVVRDTMGFQLSPTHALGRAALKWLLIPGWIGGLLDPLERCLHDQLAGTLVLKGRIKPGARRE